MESCFRVGIHVGCKTYRVGITGPDGTVLEDSMSPTPASHRARHAAGGEGAVSRKATA
jgi:hypothetical protein